MIKGTGRCNCRSYNKPEWGGTEPELVLDPPWWSERGYFICVDPCIAHVIRHLWDHDVVTKACCCGHNQPGIGPMVVLGDGQSPAGVRELIRSVDARHWRIQQWQLVEVTEERPTPKWFDMVKGIKEPGIIGLPPSETKGNRT